MKHILDIDDDLLDAAQRRLGTSTMKETVNVALKLAAAGELDPAEVFTALDTLASFDFADREQAWR